MDRVPTLQAAISAWRNYLKTEFQLAPWLEGDLVFLLHLAEKSVHRDRGAVTTMEMDRLCEIAGPDSGPGRFSGLAVHDISDVEMGNLLCDCQQIARKLLCELRQQ